jgi:hypothetical protein
MCASVAASSHALIHCGVDRYYRFALSRTAVIAMHGL